MAFSGFYRSQVRLSEAKARTALEFEAMPRSAETPLKRAAFHVVN